MKILSIAFLIAAVAVSLPFSAMAVPKGCAAYEPGEITLNGTLHRISLGWTFELEKPTCIEGKEFDKTGMYPTEDAVKMALLVFHKDASPESFTPLINKKVKIVGTLYHKYDNSPTEVMMNVNTITEIKE